MRFEHLEGVLPSMKKNGERYYRSSVTYKGKHISLGGYAEASLAHQAYQIARKLLAADSGISLTDYSSDSVLPFEKWVILLNFRENKLYFGVPIYIRYKYFYYYLSPEHILKFDMDDLFYYASHKIMCRGKHYFVAEYGMQVNIANRYGIKNYGVEGVDFIFSNGDPTDFRRENIEIRNIYHGVRRQLKGGKPVYCARIHIRGNYMIGLYQTDIEAAVAYNKAIDILQKKGVTKQYTPNYIESLTPRQYADLYSTIRISPRILAYSSSPLEESLTKSPKP
jgi:hypothetical protein